MTDNIKTLVERLRHQFKTKNVFAACDLIEQQARRIAELEAARIAYASEFPADAEGLPDVGNVHANIRLLKKRIADLEAITTIPDYAMPPGDQEWEMVDPAVAFHLIERHAENWAHAGQLMEAWADARLGAQAGEPVAWRIFDGEGSYDYRDEPPPEVNIVYAAKYGRKYEPLYASPIDSAMAKDIRREALEEAARICDRMVSVSAVSYETGTACAQAIRALASKPKKTGE